MRPAKSKTVRKVLGIKVNDWLSSLPPELVSKIKDDVIVTGGCINSMLMGTPINDYDIYLRTKESAYAVALHYANLMPSNRLVEVKIEEKVNIKGEREERVICFIRSSGVAGEVNEDDDSESWLENQPELTEDKGKYHPVFISQNAITLSGGIQIITRFYGEPDVIHKNFDFVHATCCYEHKTGKLNLPPAALESMLSHSLHYTGSLYPIASIFRAKKFIERGWRVSAGELLKIAFQVSEIDLKNIDTLNDQLTGVDAAFMNALIYSLSQEDVSKVDSTYVATLIDKIFNS